MLSHRVEGVANHPERLERADGAWSVIHRDRAPAVTGAPWRRVEGAVLAAVEDPDGVSAVEVVRPDALPEGDHALWFHDGLTVSWRTLTGASVRHVDHDGDALLWVLDGSATLESPFGALRVFGAEHVWIPRGVAHRWVVDAAAPLRAVALTLRGELSLPPGSRNALGQLGPAAPFGHRDARGPTFTRREGAHDATSPTTARSGGALWSCDDPRDPLRAVGWEGAVYPVALAWETPLLRAPRAPWVDLVACGRTTVTMRRGDGDATALPLGEDRVTLCLDHAGGAVLVREPATMAPRVRWGVDDLVQTWPAVRSVTPFARSATAFALGGDRAALVKGIGSAGQIL